MGPFIYSTANWATATFSNLLIINVMWIVDLTASLSTPKINSGWRRDVWELPGAASMFHSRRPATCDCNVTLTQRHSTRKFYKPLPLWCTKPLSVAPVWRTSHQLLMRLLLNDRRPVNLSWFYSMDEEPGQPFCLYKCNGNANVDSRIFMHHGSVTYRFWLLLFELIYRK